VITLAQVLVAPNESRTSPSTEPRLVMAGRMFAAASATPASRSPPAAAAAGCELGGAPPAGGVAGLLAVACWACALLATCWKRWSTDLGSSMSQVGCLHERTFLRPVE